MMENIIDRMCMLMQVIDIAQQIEILTGEILAGEIPGKYMKQIKNKVEKNRGFC